jgi:hypothetical protein
LAIAGPWHYFLGCSKMDAGGYHEEVRDDEFTPLHTTARFAGIRGAGILCAGLCHRPA